MKNENETKEVFKPEHVGQPVHCAIRGNGYIKAVNLSDKHQVIVEFDGLCEFACDEYKTVSIALFSVEGRCLRHGATTLSFGHKTQFDYGTPVFVYKPLKFTGFPTWCRVGCSIEEIENDYLIRQVIAANKESDLFAAVPDELTNTECANIYDWPCAMALTDDELEAKGK